jgi:hypothetical protein
MYSGRWPDESGELFIMDAVEEQYVKRGGLVRETVRAKSSRLRTPAMLSLTKLRSLRRKLTVHAIWIMDVADLAKLL